jgi:hypothetical protein
VFGRPAVFGRLAVFVRPAPGLVRFVVVLGRFAVLGRLVVFERLGVVVWPVFEVFVRPAVLGRLGVVVWPLFVLCEGAEWLCDALCDGALGFDGAFGALPLCSWPRPNAGIAMASRSTHDICSIHPLRDPRAREL